MKKNVKASELKPGYYLRRRFFWLIETIESNVPLKDGWIVVKCRKAGETHGRVTTFHFAPDETVSIEIVDRNLVN